MILLRLTLRFPASGNGLHSRSGLKDRPSTLLLGALASWIFDLSPCSSIGVAGLLNLGARESGTLEERLRGGKPSSRSGHSPIPERKSEGGRLAIPKCMEISPEKKRVDEAGIGGRKKRGASCDAALIDFKAEVIPA